MVVAGKHVSFVTRTHPAITKTNVFLIFQAGEYFLSVVFVTPHDLFLASSEIVSFSLSVGLSTVYTKVCFFAAVIALSVKPCLLG